MLRLRTTSRWRDAAQGSALGLVAYALLSRLVGSGSSHTPPRSISSLVFELRQRSWAHTHRITSSIHTPPPSAGLGGEEKSGEAGSQGSLTDSQGRRGGAEGGGEPDGLESQMAGLAACVRRLRVGRRTAVKLLTRSPRATPRKSAGRHAGAMHGELHAQQPEEVSTETHSPRPRAPSVASTSLSSSCLTNATAAPQSELSYLLDANTSRFLASRGRVVGKSNREKFNGLPRSSNNLVLCRYCACEVKPPRRTFCSPACVHQYRLRTDTKYIREVVLARDAGVCAACARNAHMLYIAAAEVSSSHGNNGNNGNRKRSKLSSAAIILQILSVSTSTSSSSTTTTNPLSTATNSSSTAAGKVATQGRRKGQFLKSQY